MHLDPLLPYLAGVVLAVLFAGMVMKKLGQPYVIGYILVGLCLGPHALRVIEDPLVLDRLGAIGVVLLLFFVGLEISLPKLMAHWKIAILGTLLQILISVGVVLVLGWYMEWPLVRSLLLGMVISTGSTVVLIKLLEQKNLMGSKIGQEVIAILVVQDMALVPMLITLNMAGGTAPTSVEILKQVVGAILIIGLLTWSVTRGKRFSLPFGKSLNQDKELQVFAAMLLCFGLAFITGWLELSTAAGAFVGGIMVSSIRETEWVHHSLQPFSVVFVSLFFISIGMLIDLHFLAENWKITLTVCLAALITNTFINGLLFRFLRRSWPESLYFGGLFASIGEFSFVLAAVGLQTGGITNYGYQLVVITIAATLLVSPFWIIFMQKITGYQIES